PLSRASRREMQQAARHASLEVAPGDPLRARSRGYGYGFGAHESCDFDRIVSHGGGLPGFGSVIALLPDRGVAVVGATNLTYPAPDPWPALVLLAQKGAIPQRQVRPAPELSQAAQAVAALLEQWDPALAQARFDRTAWYYEPPDELKTELAELHAKLGPCRPGQLEPENALRGTQSLSCERGTLHASLTRHEGRASARGEQLDLEDERGVGRDGARKSLLAVAHLGRDGQLAPAAHLHPDHALVPALDDLPAAERERKRLPVVLGRVELLPVGEPARVVHRDRLPLPRFRAGAYHQILHLQLRHGSLFRVAGAPARASSRPGRATRQGEGGTLSPRLLPARARWSTVPGARGTARRRR